MKQPGFNAQGNRKCICCLELAAGDLDHPDICFRPVSQSKTAKQLRMGIYYHNPWPSWFHVGCVSQCFDVERSEQAGNYQRYGPEAVVRLRPTDAALILEEHALLEQVFGEG